VVDLVVGPLHRAHPCPQHGAGSTVDDLLTGEAPRAGVVAVEDEERVTVEGLAGRGMAGRESVGQQRRQTVPVLGVDGVGEPDQGLAGGGWCVHAVTVRSGTDSHGDPG